jgi:hypothetical protein
MKHCSTQPPSSPSRSASGFVPLFSSLLLTLAACSGGADATLVAMAPAPATGSDGPSGESDAADADSPAIVIVERVFAPEGRFYYASVVAEMPTGPIDRASAREFTSADIEAYGGAFYLRDRESNKITRFTVSDDLELIEGASFSLQGFGLPAVRFHNVYLSAQRAYLVDRIGLRLIEWNPTSMALTGNELSVDYIAKPGMPDISISPPVQVGSRIISSIAWEDSENQMIYPGTGALLFDPESSEPPELVEDARLAGAYKVNDDGADAYVSGVAYAHAVYSTTPSGEPIPPSGVLRIANDEPRFDASYLIDLTAMTGSPGIYGIHRVDERFLLVQMFDPGTPLDAYATHDDFFAAPEYIYGLVDTQEMSWRLVDTIPKAGAGNTLDHIVDGRLYVQAYEEISPDVEDAIIYEASPGGVEEAFRVPSGDLWYLKRIR